jgi:hypothetical protein
MATLQNAVSVAVGVKGRAGEAAGGREYASLIFYVDHCEPVGAKQQT